MSLGGRKVQYIVVFFADDNARKLDDGCLVYGPSGKRTCNAYIKQAAVKGANVDSFSLIRLK